MSRSIENYRTASNYPHKVVERLKFIPFKKRLIIIHSIWNDKQINEEIAKKILYTRNPKKKNKKPVMLSPNWNNFIFPFLRKEDWEEKGGGLSSLRLKRVKVGN